MNELMRRRRALMMAKGEIDNGNLVVSFTPVTRSFDRNTYIAVSLTEAVGKEKTYRVVLDATVPTGYRFLVLLGAVNNQIQYFPEGQDGIEERTWKTTVHVNAPNAYIFCRPVSGTGTVTATIRNIKVYREGW